MGIFGKKNNRGHNSSPKGFVKSPTIKPKVPTAASVKATVIVRPTADLKVPNELYMGKTVVDLDCLQDAIFAIRKSCEKAWSAETSVGEYTPEFPSTGQCAVTAMIVQDMLGGELVSVTNMGVSHYYNKINLDPRYFPFTIDLTKDQFDIWNPSAEEIHDRAYLEKSESTIKRYNILRNKLGFKYNIKSNFGVNKHYPSLNRSYLYTIIEHK